MVRLARRAALAATLTAALAACSPKSGSPSQCAVGQILCSGICVNASSDVKNCGGCGVACPAPAGGGTATCNAGLCGGACAAPSALCTARSDGGSVALACTDTRIDPENCGGCGIACLPQQSCNGGQCTSCLPGQLQCPVTGGTQCTAVLSDNNNCGGCGNKCAAGSSCQEGACVANGLSNCGNADGGGVDPVDLQNDRSNCGACGYACVAGEICRAGACQACPAAQCGNACVDFQRDRLNCGACNNSCRGNAQCVSGACANGISVTVQAPAAAGVVPFTPFTQTVRVDSALEVRAVVADMTEPMGDGGTAVQRTQLSLVGSGVNATPTFWSGTLVPDGGSTWTGSITVTAWDTAWRPDAGDAPLHTASATASPLTAVLPPNPTVTLAATAAGGGSIPAGAWIPLNADPVTFTASGLDGGTASVNFYDRAIQNNNPPFGAALAAAPGMLLGNSPVTDAGTASLTLAPGEIAIQIPAGGAQIGANVFACAVDSAGQTGTCSNSINASIGRVPVSGSVVPVMTAQADGGSPVLWYHTTPATSPSQLVGAPANVIANSGLPLTPTLGADGGTSYFTGTLTPAETSASVTAVRGDGTGVDRWDCLGSSSCNRYPWIAPGSFALRSTAAITPKVVLMTEANSTYVYALPSAAGAPAGTATATGTSPAASLSASVRVQTMPNGAVVYYGSDTPTGGPYAPRLIAPGATPIQAMGAHHNGAPVNLTVTSDAIVWQYVDPSGGTFVQAASYDGTTVGTATGAFPLGNAGAVSWLEVRPRIFLGVAADRTTGTNTIVEIDVTAGKNTITKLTTPVANGAVGTGGVGAFVRSRVSDQDLFAVSDDQQKAIFVTEDNTGNATFPDTYTLYIADLATSTAQVVYGSPFLKTPNSGVITSTSDLQPRFVHSAAGWALSAGASPGALAGVPAIVFADGLSSDVGLTLPGYTEARLFYAFYKADASAPQPVAVDRIALSYSGTTPDLAMPNYYAGESAAGATMLFAGLDDSGRPSMYSVPLNAATTGTASALPLLPGGWGLQLREDTARFLTVSSTGVLYAGKLQAGTDPASTLAPIATGLPGGPISANYATDIKLFGFTPDGTHAWAIQQYDAQDLQWLGNQQSIGGMEIINIDARARSEVGPAEIFPYVSIATGAPDVCVLGQAGFALASAPVAPDQQGAQLAFLTRASPFTRYELGLPASSQPLHCQISVDATEARFLTSDLTNGRQRLSTAVPQATGSPAVRSLPSYNTTRYQVASVATQSPRLGAPYAPQAELDEHQLAPSSSGVDPVLRWSYSVLGESGAFPSGPPFVKVISAWAANVSTGLALSPSTARYTDSGRQVLLPFMLTGSNNAPNGDTSGAWVMELPIAHPPPAPLLP